MFFITNVFFRSGKAEKIRWASGDGSNVEGDDGGSGDGRSGAAGRQSADRVQTGADAVHAAGAAAPDGRRRHGQRLW